MRLQENHSLFKTIRKLCIDKDIKLRQLEEDLNISTGAIYKWVESSPSADKIVKVALYFNVSTDFLLGLEVD